MQDQRKHKQHDGQDIAVLSTADCLAILKEHQLPATILRHVRKVDGVCMYLAEKLRLQGISVDVAMLHAAALLHDVKKMEQVHGKVAVHEEAGGDYLTHLGYPIIGDVIKAHATSAIFHMLGLEHKQHEPMQHASQQSPATSIAASAWEKRLIYYADKRVKHDMLVSIDERLDDAIQRYPDEKPLLERIRGPLQELEKEIFKNARLRSVEEADIIPYLIDEGLLT